MISILSFHFISRLALIILALPIKIFKLTKLSTEVEDPTLFKTRQEGKTVIFEYIEVFITDNVIVIISVTLAP